MKQHLISTEHSMLGIFWWLPANARQQRPPNPQPLQSQSHCGLGWPLPATPQSPKQVLWSSGHHTEGHILGQRWRSAFLLRGDLGGTAIPEPWGHLGWQRSCDTEPHSRSTALPCTQVHDPHLALGQTDPQHSQCLDGISGRQKVQEIRRQPLQ